MNQELRQLLCDLISLPSVNPEHQAGRTEAPYGEGRMADYVQRYFQPFGVRIERHEALPGRENVLVHIPGQSPQPFLLEAHMDTVDVQGMADPFVPRIEDGRIYGRGACDTKASLAAMMMALKQLLGKGVSLPRSCVLAATADEEFGMAGALRLVKAGMNFSGAIVGEPTALNVVSAHNGQVYFKIVAHGQAAHTSQPQHGVNAIYVMNEVINVLRRRMTSLYSQRQHPLCGSPLLTVALIQGGTSEHVVPDKCEITLDRRTIPGETWQQAVAEIKTWLAEDLDAEIFQRVEFLAPFKTVPPMEIPADHPLVKGLRLAVEGVRGDAQVVGVPYNTNASHYAAAGVPCVVFGPGNIAQAHSVDEFVEIEQVEAAVEILKRFLLESAA